VTLLLDNVSKITESDVDTTASGGVRLPIILSKLREYVEFYSTSERNPVIFKWLGKAYHGDKFYVFVKQEKYQRFEKIELKFKYPTLSQSLLHPSHPKRKLFLKPGVYHYYFLVDDQKVINAEEKWTLTTENDLVNVLTVLSKSK
jgi:hypothetical protein